MQFVSSKKKKKKQLGKLSTRVDWPNLSSSRKSDPSHSHCPILELNLNLNLNLSCRLYRLKPADCKLKQSQAAIVNQLLLLLLLVSLMMLMKCNSFGIFETNKHTIAQPFRRFLLPNVSWSVRENNSCKQQQQQHWARYPMKLLL